MTGQVLFWALTALSVVGALAVVAAREVMRMALGLGAFLLALAGFFALFGFGFLALAEVFVYVGGVLVLVLFAIMLVHRGAPGTPSLESRHDPLAAVASAGVAALSAAIFRPLVPNTPVAARLVEGDLGDALLGRMLPHFELAGLLMLAALVAVVAVSGRSDEEDAE